MPSRTLSMPRTCKTRPVASVTTLSPQSTTPFRSRSVLHKTLTPPGMDSTLGVYHPSRTGILSYLPTAWVPYAELIRIDKPTGTIYLLLPCLWSTLMAATLTPTIATIPTILQYSSLFALGALVMRGAGCTINDLIDRKIDPLVARTKFRPIARGAISTENALVFTFAQLLAGLCVLLQFPAEAIFTAIPSLLLVGTYPLAKRITHYPQFVLGLTFSWGALLGFPSLGLSLTDPHILAISSCLYASNVCWTVLYDTIYAHQDVADDVKAGIKSIAVKHENDTKKIMVGLGIAQISLLAAAGTFAGTGPVFFMVSCGGGAAGLAWMIWRARLKVTKDCWFWFKWCAWAVGGLAVGGGMVLEYSARRWGLFGYEERGARKAVEY